MPGNYIAASQADYRTVAHIFQKETGVAPTKVTRELVLEWRDEVLDRAAVATWNSYFWWLRNLFAFAVRSGWLAENPFRDMRVLPSPAKKKTVSKKL